MKKIKKQVYIKDKKFIKINDIKNVPIKGFNQKKIDSYINLIDSNNNIEEILVRKTNDGLYWLKDGAHRIQAYKFLEIKYIKAKIC